MVSVGIGLARTSPKRIRIAALPADPKQIPRFVSEERWGWYIK
jgi:hypothetical protein